MSIYHGAEQMIVNDDCIYIGAEHVVVEMTGHFLGEWNLNKLNMSDIVYNLFFWWLRCCQWVVLLCIFGIMINEIPTNNDNYSHARLHEMFWA